MNIKLLTITIAFSVLISINLVHAQTSGGGGGGGYTAITRAGLFSKDLKLGDSDKADSSEHVYLLNTFLKDEGFLKIQPAKKFDKNTKYALIKFQKKHKLNTTGIFNSTTRAKANAIVNTGAQQIGAEVDGITISLNQMLSQNNKYISKLNNLKNSYLTIINNTNAKYDSELSKYTSDFYSGLNQLIDTSIVSLETNRDYALILMNQERWNIVQARKEIQAVIDSNKPVIEIAQRYIDEDNETQKKFNAFVVKYYETKAQNEVQKTEQARYSRLLDIEKQIILRQKKLHEDKMAAEKNPGGTYGNALTYELKRLYDQYNTDFNQLQITYEKVRLGIE